MSEEELFDKFHNFWSGCIRTYQLTSIETSPSNHDYELDWRERYACAPAQLGFVNLDPMRTLTPAGKALVSAHRTEEIFLRQLLKFQFPSPYHTQGKRADDVHFCVKPYLEMLRLVRHFGTLRFDELKLFALQLTDYHNFSRIVGQIERFRRVKTGNTGSYRTFLAAYTMRVLRKIYAEELKKGDIKTRESRDKSQKKFFKTKGDNMRDYADACVRYLRATGLVNVSHVGRSLSIAPDRVADVDYLLKNISREPVFVDDEAAYTAYLGDATIPTLYTDDRQRLLQKLQTEFPEAQFEADATIAVLKDFYTDLLEQRKQDKLAQQVRDIKDYRLYDSIRDVFQQIRTDRNLYDAPLMLEWNTWRAMTMLDGGDIRANLKFDDNGQPMNAAGGNMADIVCDYGDFSVSVEVTMASGQRQYETESESVARHLGRIKKDCGKPAYCLFIAPTINEACVAHFFMLHKTSISFYGGQSVIVPLPLHLFEKMVEDSYKASYTPNPQQVRSFFEYSQAQAALCADERQWYDSVTQKALDWLV